MAAQQKVLRAIQTNPNEWVTRSMLAKRLRQQRLNSGNLVVLYLLEASGQIEAREVPAERGIGFRIEYRATSPRN